MAPSRLYETVLRDPARPIWIRLHRAFSGWVQTKGFPAPETGPARHEHELDGSRLLMERRSGCGRYTLHEPGLRTKVVFLDGNPGWTLIRVEGEGGLAEAPGFVPDYLRTARITDGAIHVEDRAAVVAEDEVPQLLRTLSEPRRRVPVIVVTPSAANVARADRLAAAVSGAGLVARLADRHAEDRFNQVLGRELGVYGGAIRTYAAPFDPATERSPFRHPPMRPAKLDEEGALATIADGAIGRTAASRLPADVERALPIVLQIVAGRADFRKLATATAPRPAPVDPAREELRAKMMALTVRPAPAPEPEPDPEPEPEAAPVPVTSGLAHEVADAVVKEIRQELETALGLAAGRDSTGQVLREVRTLGLHLAGLRDLVIPSPHDALDLRAEHELLQEEYAEAVHTSRQLAERVRWLERALAESGHPVYGQAAPTPVFQPGSLAETLVEARTRLTRVVIGDTDAAAVHLDHTHPALCRAWAAKAWDALRALDDFARARSTGAFTGGFYDWCAHGDAGRLVIPVGMLAMRESTSVTTNTRFSDPRTFPVPAEVHPSGRLLMESHIKLRPVGYPAPRMYFHDDSGGATGKIWIGYLGDHLPNTRTN